MDNDYEVVIDNIIKEYINFKQECLEKIADVDQTNYEEDYITDYIKGLKEANEVIKIMKSLKQEVKDYRESKKSNEES